MTSVLRDAGIGVDRGYLVDRRHRDGLAGASTLEAVRRQIPKGFASLAADNPGSVPIVVRADGN